MSACARASVGAGALLAHPQWGAPSPAPRVLGSSARHALCHQARCTVGLTLLLRGCAGRKAAASGTSELATAPAMLWQSLQDKLASLEVMSSTQVRVGAWCGAHGPACDG